MKKQNNKKQKGGSFKPKRNQPLKNKNRGGKFFTKKQKLNNTFAPASIGQIIRNQNPRNTFVVEHKEFVADVLRASGEKRDEFDINPGVSRTFPWLSRIAQNYETYIFEKLEFHYIASCPTSTFGSVLLAPDYDPSDDQTIVGKTQLFTYDDCVRASIWQSFCMKCRKSNLTKLKQYYVRTGSVKSTEDVKFYDTAKLIVLTSSTAGDFAGELWVNYKIRFFTPQVEPEVVHSSTMVVEDAVTTLANPFGYWDNGILKAQEFVGDAKIEVYDVGSNILKMWEPGPHLISSILRVVGDSTFSPATILPSITSAVEGEEIVPLSRKITESGAPPETVQAVLFDFIVNVAASRSYKNPLRLIFNMVTGTAFEKGAYVSQNGTEGINLLSIKDMNIQEYEALSAANKKKQKEKKEEKKKEGDKGERIIRKEKIYYQRDLGNKMAYGPVTANY